MAERASGGVRGENSEELRREKLVELYDAIQPGDGSMPDMDRIRSTAEHVWPILSAVSDPAEPSGSRVTAPPPEPSEAMREALATLQAIVDNSLCERCDPNGKLLIRASNARWPLEAALAVSPGCRGAELAEALEAYDLDSGDARSFVERKAEAGAVLADAVREALAAVRASGEAGP